MGYVIVDPVKGTGARVDLNQRLQVGSETITEKDWACVKGWKFNINTGDITLTSAAKTTVLYVKNEGLYDLSIDTLIYNIGESNVTAGDIVIDVIRNPTTGDIITNTNNVEVGTGVEANQNFGSTNVITGKLYKGATGETVVNGSKTISTRSANETGRFVIALGNLIVPQGNAIAIDYTPPTSNTSQTVQFAFASHIRHPEVADIS